MALDTPILTTTAIPGQTAAAEDDPLWYKDAIIYQAHVRTFFDSNNDGIGDFNGLIQKLDYLYGLGVTCLWLLPFFPSPLRDDGYDIADYRDVHPSYGTLDDFKALVAAARERRIRIMIELVVNHTSDQHPWFVRARQAPPGSPEREFYIWSDTDKKFPETRVIFTDSEKSNWSWDPVAGQYYWHRFFSFQPDLNHNNPEVVDAVIDVMKFWFDIGVDALRLDAVPYLCVREGTNNENLPETHEVLKHMRRELDRSYPNRMLLAEANQWPSDVRAYFGDGDECHMAFHFPLMPRMFMAIRQEDRHAITEILLQTPDIPESCQWALFLRNHDELTLEMVTDEERDYMYAAYAADPQMRLNVGIRRRLAPLIENNRMRFELLHGLLFSLPGTPVVYYGDEIGMGDNIYLGDRNGVRTPMQWSGDRNGGFSRVDPARLFAPAIMDPVYGYQAINVEAQERAPFSLLNWLKRLIAMRKQHRVFGRGALQLVGCANRKVLAYLRRDERETVLVAANLSPFVQPAELQLEAFAGLIPVEMTGLTEFPRIEDRPYPLTLGPYACYWLTLQPASRQAAGRAADPSDHDAAIAQSMPSLFVGADWQGILDGSTRVLLEKRALIPFIERQRWFASKARRIAAARFFDWAPLRKGAYPAFLAVAAVDFDRGPSERYFMPLALMPREPADRLLRELPGAVLSRITGARKGALVDAFYDDEFCGRLLEAIESRRDLPSRHGRIRGVAWAAAPAPPDTPKIVRAGADQSNSLALVNDRAALKLIRRVEPGTNPELEVGRHLHAHGFTRTPQVLGALEYHDPAGPDTLLALAQTLAGHQGSGWDFTIDELRRYYERVQARTSRTDSGDASADAPARPTPPNVEGVDGPPPFFAAVEAWYLASAATLGRRTAEMHLALAGGAEPAFAPEPLTHADLDALAGAMRTRATAALDLLEGRLLSLPEEVRTRASALLAVRDALLLRFDRIRGLAAPGLRTRVHGDYHLGQVLRAEEDFVILDFEGEPARTIEERRAKQSPVKDVAGMIRSFSYAAHAAMLAASIHAPDRVPELEAWADEWQHWISHAFVSAYLNAIGQAGLVPSGDSFRPLLEAMLLDKAAYELAYELNARPDWVWIPITGMLKLLR
ncbi:MAG: maltose alpha-D-glucosyltransferase [Acidobacteria bacterium]|nr:maltose alpha-D-glucosyltransferase [Acidobacteriota bacterium]